MVHRPSPTTYAQASTSGRQNPTGTLPPVVPHSSFPPDGSPPGPPPSLLQVSPVSEESRQTIELTGSPPAPGCPDPPPSPDPPPPPPPLPPPNWAASALP